MYIGYATYMHLAVQCTFSGA